MTPTEELQNIDAQIDRLTREVERLLWERREVINRANLNKGAASAPCPAAAGYSASGPCRSEARLI